VLEEQGIPFNCCVVGMAALENHLYLNKQSTRNESARWCCAISFKNFRKKEIASDLIPEGEVCRYNYPVEANGNHYDTMPWLQKMAGLLQTQLRL